MQKPSIERFVATVKQLCAQRGDIQAVANAAGIGRVTLSRIINGQQAPTLEIALRISVALDTDLSTLASTVIAKSDRQAS